ncbi:MAG TPA: sugar transferase, partial [Gemmataceae bacterium]|nr:sugar transferase [Gemmataceae bacterium]
MIINGDARHNGHMVRLDSAHARFGQFKPAPLAGRYGPLKVVVDAALTLVILVLAAPVLLLACVVVKLTSRGPMLYCQTRLGRGGKPYTIYK